MPSGGLVKGDKATTIQHAPVTTPSTHLVQTPRLCTPKSVRCYQECAVTKRLISVTLKSTCVKCGMQINAPLQLR